LLYPPTTSFYSQHIFHYNLIEEACHPSPCGVNTKCEVVNYQPVCSCLPSFKGNPLTGCTHECESDHDCSSSQYCKNYKCQSSCDQCGKGALCNGVVNHRPQCECPKTYIGSPFTECRPECYGDVDCPHSKPACFYGICKNPCEVRTYKFLFNYLIYFIFYSFILNHILFLILLKT
jgi:hypothetical protein